VTLGSIVARVENELQYRPDLREYRLDIRQVANAQWGLLARDKPWPFLQRRAPLIVLPDLTFANSAVSFPGVATYGPRAISIADSQFSTYAELGDWTGQIRRLLPGGEFGVTDRSVLTMGGSSNWEDGPFVVELAMTHPGQSPARTLLYLDPRCILASLTGSEGTYTLKFPRYVLPPDVDVLERILDANGNPIRALDPRGERDAAIDASADGGSNPAWFLEDHGHRPQYPPFVYPEQSDTSSPNPDQTLDLYQRDSLPIRISITIGHHASTAGAFAVGTRVRAFICWWYAGRFGPPSPEVTFTTTDATKALQFSGWTGKLLPLGPAAAPGAYGRRVALFVSENDGAFYFRGFADPASAVVSTQSITVPYPIDTGSDTPAAIVKTLKADGTPALPRYDQLHPGGPYTYVRLYPRPSEAARFELDYLARPAHLIEDTDQPELPEQFSEVLVWATCLGMAQRYERGNTTVWERNFREWKMRLEQRYMPQMRYRLIAGYHGMGVRPHWFTASNVRYLG